MTRVSYGFRTDHQKDTKKLQTLFNFYTYFLIFVFLAIFLMALWPEIALVLFGKNSFYRENDGLMSIIYNRKHICRFQFFCFNDYEKSKKE